MKNEPNSETDEEKRPDTATLTDNGDKDDNGLRPNNDNDSFSEDDDDNDEGFDLRCVSATQMACPGYDLLDLMAYDEDVTADTFKRLNLTAYEVEDDVTGLPHLEVEEIDPEKFYLVTFPDGTDMSALSVSLAISVEEFSEKCFNDLDAEEEDISCDGDCEHCPQDCIGKLPVL